MAQEDRSGGDQPGHADLQVDAGDQAERVCGLAVGDLNADGVNELEIGASLAASRDNPPQAGEVRLYEPGSSWLVSVDLATETPVHHLRRYYQ